MVLNLVLLLIGLTMLYGGGGILVRAAVKLAQSLGIPSVVIGATIVAWATSAPELVVNVDAALADVPTLAIGNVLGSNMANIGLTLGLLAIAFKVRVDRTLVRREIPIMVAVALLLGALTLDGELGRLDGVIMFMGFIVFTGFVVLASLQERRNDINNSGLQADQTIKVRWLDGLQLLLGIGILVVAANLTVDNATAIAQQFGVSELIIGLTIVAVGTSLPEIAASLVAGMRNETDIAVGNLVGSNIANTLGILGLTAIIQPLALADSVIKIELFIFIVISVILWAMVLRQRITRWQGVLLLFAYGIFILYAVTQQGGAPP